MKFLCVILLILYSCMESKSEHFKVVGPAALLVAEAGEDLVLPCSIQPSTSAVDMRVEWSRVNVVDSLVHLYKDNEDKNENQDQSYRGRTALFREELLKGNTSLKLSAVRVSDEGAYKCFIKDKSWYDDITVNVIVKALGTHPVITMEGFNSGGINLACESRDWNPEPEVLWLDREGVTLTAEDTETHRDTEGFRVKCSITVYNSDSNRFYCRLQQRHHMRETEIIISSQVFNSWTSVVAVISVLAIIIAMGSIAVAVIYHKKDAERKRLQEELLKEKVYSELVKKKRSSVDVTLDADTAYPYLILSDDGKEVRCGDTKQNLPNNPERFDRWPNVLGREGFFSGKFYYEVQVRGKTKWILGVARESINRKGEITLNPQNGFWTVWLRKGHEYRALAGPSVILSLKEKPQKVGVFVDYEEGLVSFYDVEARSHIHSFTGQSFTEKLYPFFSPSNNDGGENSAPLIISVVNHDE
ncbi:butyrophilin subfamily 1 member A1-like isoform X2 [Colossoma macropomum]|uniref:butyrophilin subfamily 1 member A1-like isoform X2 n=1 Tax=Colossoma macropomum TaxID=42526 RepID=UPI0018641F4C|nr:butyrophilin subfamily 1 member A1-like isoform X2 [Colossoma macropomum]